MSRMDGDGLGLHDEDGYYNDDDENLSDTDPEDDEWETAAVQQICSYGVCVCVCVRMCVCAHVCVCVCVDMQLFLPLSHPPSQDPTFNKVAHVYFIDMKIVILILCALYL